MSSTITFIISLTYAIPSISLYLITIFIICKHGKVFNSSFFKIYSYDCFMNLLTYSKTFTTMRVPSVTCYNCLLAPVLLSSNDHLPMPFIFSIGYHMAYVQYAMTTLISVNRLTVLLNFNFFEPIWRRYVWLMMLAVLLFPFVSTRVALNYHAAFIYVNSTDAYTLSSQVPTWDLYTYLIPFMLISIIVSLIANIASLVCVRSANLVKANRAESNFIIITSITCAIQLIGTVLSIGLLTVQHVHILSFLSFTRLFVSDGLTLVQPWLLLFFSYAIRDKMKRMFGLRTKTPMASTMFKSRSMTLP
ncbi:unnamed protein product [Caenorhabditis sp. 36 PRJEB53466]|nr:unnamed protein product [Caenorhabditis sp. 36 PRJEB53466]